MSIDFQRKFQDNDLTETDCALLLKRIEDRKDDHAQLISLLYIYGRSCREDPTIIALCDRYIQHPVPGLTAVCMRVLIDYWSKWEKYESAIAKYIDAKLYEDWYDEVIFASSFVNRNRDLYFSAATKKRFVELASTPFGKTELHLTCE